MNRLMHNLAEATCAAFKSSPDDRHQVFHRVLCSVFYCWSHKGLQGVLSAPLCLLKGPQELVLFRRFLRVFFHCMDTQTPKSREHSSHFIF